MMTKIFLVVFLISSCSLLLKTNTPEISYPESWPETEYDFETNPLTENGFQLGRMLFYDPILSRDSTISCASCHFQATGFAHVDHDLSHGIEGRVGTRSSIPLMNLAWSTSFMADGGVPNLDRQAIAPITSHDEMDETLVNVILKLNRSPKYQKAFKKTFGQKEATVQNMLFALSQFELSLVTANSKYDRYINGTEEFSDQEKKGLRLFNKHCFACHQDPLFSSNEFTDIGLSIDKDLKDFGRMKITGLSRDSLMFKVPTLRNIKFTYPYMHDGRFETLREVMKHYATGIEDSPNVDRRLRSGFNLSENDQTDIIAFMLTLTDREFLENPRFGFPKEDYFDPKKENKN